MNADFSYQFWIIDTRNGIIHRKGSIRGEFRRQVIVGLRLQSNKEDGSTSICRDDPPADNRLYFAIDLDKKEGGKVIVDKCREYLNALTQMIEEWEKIEPLLD